MSVYFSTKAYDLFQRGYDTLDIANLLQRPESDILRDINQARSFKLGLTYPYPPHHLPASARPPRLVEVRAAPKKRVRKKRVRFAGFDRKTAEAKA